MVLLRAVVAAGAFLAAGCGSPQMTRQPDPNVRIVAFGDSATRGPASADYTLFLPDLLGVPEDAVANEGLAGETTDAGTRRLAVLIDRALFPNADTLLLWQGGNDLVDFVEENDPQLVLFFELFDGLDSPLRAELNAALDGIEANLVSAVQRAQDAGWGVYLLTYYPLSGNMPCPLVPAEYLFPFEAAVFNEYVDALNVRIREAAGQTGATLVDVAAVGETLGPADYFNCNHLSASGNAQVAALIAEAMGDSRNSMENLLNSEIP